MATRKAAASSVTNLVATDDLLAIIFDRLSSAVLVHVVMAVCKDWQMVACTTTSALDFGEEDEVVLDRGKCAAKAARYAWPALRALELWELDDLHSGFIGALGCNGFAQVTALELSCAETLTALAIRCVLDSMPSVTALALVGGTGEAAFKALLSSDRSDTGLCARLRALRIGVNPYDDDDLSEEDPAAAYTADRFHCTSCQLSELAGLCPSLRSLEANSLAGLDHAALKAMEELTCLVLKDSSKPTWSSLFSLRRLHTLHLLNGSIGFDHDGADADLRQMLEHCIELTELVIYGVDSIDGSGFQPSWSGCRLKRLALVNCIGLTNAGVQCIAAHPLEKLAISEMDLECHEKGREPTDVIGAQGIVDVASRCRALRDLNLDNEQRGVAAVMFKQEQLLRILEQCPHLQSVAVSKSTRSMYPMTGIWSKVHPSNVDEDGVDLAHSRFWYDVPQPAWQGMKSFIRSGRGRLT